MNLFPAFIPRKGQYFLVHTHTQQWAVGANQRTQQNITKHKSRKCTLAREALGGGGGHLALGSMNILTVPTAIYCFTFFRTNILIVSGFG